MPESVFIEITRKSKFDFPPTRISPSDIASRVLRQARTSMDSMINAEFLRAFYAHASKRRDCTQCALGCQRTCFLRDTAVNQENTPVIKE